MNKIFNSAFLIVAVYLGCNLLVSCANIGTITGGDKDSIPPVMMASKPVFLDTNYKGEKVYILFNEFYNLKDVNQEFYSSPPFKETPDFKIRKKGLLVKFNEPLKDSVTYTLNFGKAIVDYNEGNVLKNFRFVFSTGSKIDSFSIAGNLRNAIDQSAPEKSLVMVFDKDNDSIPFKSLPTYLSKTDSSGNFSIDFIKPGAYKVFAVSDKNNNQKADFFESRAFLDSLIVPKRSTWFTIDSLKAGTILHDTIYHITDSLENDTVIINHKFKTIPANLQLYLFQENNQAQKVTDFTRKEKYKANISFVLPITPDFKINPINFKIEDGDIITEKNIKNDTITWWIKNPKLQAMDSLLVDVTYPSLDSIGKPISKTDTLVLEYREKQDKDAWKRKSKKEDKIVKKEYLKLDYSLKDGKVDLNKSLRIQSPTPLAAVDTSKIRLFEIIDTVVADPKEQKVLKAFRLKKDLLTFKFKRPIAQEFNIFPMNFRAENWYTKEPADSNRFFTCRITNPEIAMMDTLKLHLDFDNHFFMKQIQVLTDTAIMPISKQKILSRKRTEADKIHLVFDKPITNQIKLIPSDFAPAPNWYQITGNPGNDSITINITDRNTSNKDTLTFSINCFDYIGFKDDSVYFNETMRSVFREKEQYLVGGKREKKEVLNLYFNKKITTDPVIEPMDTALTQPWYQFQRNAAGDTLTCLLSNPTISAKDTLRVFVKYSETDRKGKTLNYTDTLKLVDKQIRQIKKKMESATVVNNQPKTQTVHIYIPTDYKLEIDSMHIRQRLIAKKWKEKTKYLLRFDSLAFKNIFDLYNKNEDFEFASQPENYYAAILLNLTNIKPSLQQYVKTKLSDSTFTGTAEQIMSSQKELDNYVGQGKLIVQLLGEKNILLQEYFVDADKKLNLDYLAPGKYRIRIIFDRNGNGLWDTGEYFKHVQPERVITNGEELVLKSALKLELEWNVGESLIKSFTKQP